MSILRTGPLAHIRILEVAHMLAGPYCGMLLADLGAEVIKIETGHGDIARGVGGGSVGGHNAYFASLNRNKKSITLDLAVPSEKAVFHHLVSSAQGLVTNLRPRAIRKLGLTYEDLKSFNPRLACLALTGFGLKGPHSDLPAYDYVIQAMTGLMMLTGEPDAPPSRAGYSVVDNTGGMMAAIGLLAKLLEGRGGQIDVALYDTMLSQLNYLASAYLNGAEEPVRYPRGGHSFFVPAQIFDTADGYVALFITHDRFWNVFATALGREEWLRDERFATVEARNKHRELVVDAVASVLKTGRTQQWVDLLQSKGVVIAGVATLKQALESDNTASRDMICDIPTLDGPLRLIANPIKIEGVDQRQYHAPPRLGEHTDCYRDRSCPAQDSG